MEGDCDGRSIQAAKAMLESLEREDSGVLLLLLGEQDEGRAILATANSVFAASLRFAESNVTMPGEGECIDSLRVAYDAYRTLWSERIAGTDRERNLEWYSGPMQSAFGRAKTSVNGSAWTGRRCRTTSWRRACCTSCSTWRWSSRRPWCSSGWGWTLSSFSGCAATMGNVGPGLGTLGSLENFAHVPEAGKWVLSPTMLLGRLEIYGLPAMLAPRMWR